MQKFILMIILTCNVAAAFCQLEMKAALEKILNDYDNQFNAIKGKAIKNPDIYGVPKKTYSSKIQIPGAFTYIQYHPAVKKNELFARFNYKDSVAVQKKFNEILTALKKVKLQKYIFKITPCYWGYDRRQCSFYVSRPGSELRHTLVFDLSSSYDPGIVRLAIHLWHDSDPNDLEDD